MSSRRLAVLLGLAVLIVIGPIVSADTAQPASRYDLTAALAEHGSVDLGPYRHRLGVDYAEFDGHLRSDKAPGQPLLAVPVYLVGRAFGAQSATSAREQGDLGLWWVTLWSSVVPFAALVALMFLAAERFAGPAVALAVALMLGLATMMLPHAVNLYGHALAALFALSAWLAIELTPVSPRRAALAGLLAGAATVTEYETAIVMLVLAGYLAYHQRNRIVWFLAGCAGPLCVLAWYHTRAFGAPWRTAHAYYSTPELRHQITGYALSWRGFDETFFGAHGLLLTGPIVLVGLVAAVMATRSEPGAAATHARVALAIVVPYLVLCVLWKGTLGLEVPGPRYMIPALPFLAVPLAALWSRLWRPALLAAVVGALVSVPATFTLLLLGIGQPALPEYLRRLRNREFAPTIWSMVFGRLGIVFYLATVALAIAALVWAWLRVRARPAPVGTPGSRAPSVARA